MFTRKKLHKHLSESSGVFRNPKIREAFEVIDRRDFVNPDYEIEAYEDYALPIGFGQTISQPTTVAFMLELLDPRFGDSVLEIGSGSGWMTALLATLVGTRGEVIGLERIPELVELGQKNLGAYKLPNAKILPAEKNIGFENHPPFDRIIVSAAAPSLPGGLLRQLASGGILVIPVENSLWQILKDETGEIETKEFPGFAFVPLIQ